MGLFSGFRKRVKIAPFKVGIYGKLPCYKDFFYASPHSAFKEWKEVFDLGFEKLAKSGAERPYVLPNRRFYIDMKAHRMELVGCIWESDDGMRGYPFMMATLLPRSLYRESFPNFWQGLEYIWSHLESFADEIFAQTNSVEVYNLCRGTLHKLPPLQPETWEPTAESDAPLLGNMIFTRDLSSLTVSQEQHLLQSYDFKQNPAFILWPMRGWRDQEVPLATACFGESGIEDFHMGLFRKAENSDSKVT
jgi:hypothetical protein